MKRKTWLRLKGTVLGAFALFLTAALNCAAAVTATPATVTFTSPQQSATITLVDNGSPVPAKDIGDWRFIASGHDYKHMLTLERLDGAIKIAPSKTMEVGSYDLDIETAKGPATILVRAPLSDLPDIIERTEALTGLSEKKVMEKLGMSVPAGHDSIQLDLPPVYYEGQTLEITMPVKPGRVCSWFMNGDVVAEGPGQNALQYTFREPGDYVLTYVETEREGGKVTSFSRATAHTRVVPIPKVPVSVAANAEIDLAAPLGYQRYAWRVDGQQVSTEPTLKRTFKEPGTHTAECLASIPDKGPADGFARIQYLITVNPG